MSTYCTLKSVNFYNFPSFYTKGVVRLFFSISALFIAATNVNARALSDSLLRCIPPADTSVRCGDPLLTNLATLGQAVSLPGMGGNIRIVVHQPVWATNTCNQGKLIRSWQIVRDTGLATESWGDACRQVIQILPNPDFKIRFPADTTVTCTNLKGVDSVRFFGNSCNYFSVSYQDAPAPSAVGGCYRVFRTYQIINWCGFNPVLPQVVIGRDIDKNGVPGDQPVWLLSTPNGEVFLDKDSIPAEGYYISSQEEPSLRSNTYWEYQQVITVRDDVPPLISGTEQISVAGTGVDCTGDMSYSFRVSEACSPDQLRIAVSWDKFADGLPDDAFNGIVQGNYPAYKVLARLPFGSHRITLRIEDGCGNFSEKKILVTVADRRAPDFKCINSIILNLAPIAPGIDADQDGDTDQAAVTLWAEELISSPAKDCSFDVRYSLHRAEAIEAGVEQPNPNQRAITLTCDDRPTVLMYVYAWDASGNYALGETFVLLNDANGQFCQKKGAASISGSITLPDGKKLSGVDVVLSGEKIVLEQTDSVGFFSFPELKTGAAYTLQAKLDSQCKEGVSTHDIVAIYRHILGKTPFTQPRQYLAADVDESGAVTVLDIIKIRRVILGLDSCFLSAPAWQLYNAEAMPPPTENPLGKPMEKKIRILNLTENVLNRNFTAIKTGDVTGDAFIGKGSPVLIQH